MSIPSRPTRRTRAKHGGEKISIESRLLAATERLLEQGNTFATLSIDQLTKEAGIARATFYLHFKDKGELVARLMDYFLEEVTSNLGTWATNASIAERADVDTAVRAMAQAFRKHQAIVSAIRDTMPHDKNVEKIFTHFIDKVARVAVESLAQLKQRNKSRAETTPEVTEMLTHLLGLYCTYLLGNRSNAKLKKDLDALSYICTSVLFADNQ